MNKELKKHMVTIMSGNGSPLRSSGNVERNQPCGCGSGKKAKRCCGMETRYMLTGKALDDHIRKIQASEAREKAIEEARAKLKAEMQSRLQEAAL